MGICGDEDADDDDDVDVDAEEAGEDEDGDEDRELWGRGIAINTATRTFVGSVGEISDI